MTAVNQQQVKDSDTIDLGEIFRTVLGHWRLIGICVLTAIFFAILYLRMTPSVYAVDGLVQIESKQSSADALLGGAGLSGLSDVKSPADTEIQLLKSRFVLGQVIRNLNLDIDISSDKDRWYQRLIHTNTSKVSYVKDGVSYSAEGISFKVQKFNVPEVLLDQVFELDFTGSGRYTLTLVDPSNVAGFESQSVITGTVGQLLTVPMAGGYLQLFIQAPESVAELGVVYLSKKSLLQTVRNINDDLSVTEKGKLTGIVSLVYQGSNQDYIVRTLDEIMRVYLAQNIASRTEETQNTLVFLEKQLPELRAQLEASEDRYNQFREKNNTLDPTKEAELLLQQIVALKAKKIDLEQQSVLLGQKYTSNFPLIGQIKAQVSAIDQEGKQLDERVVGMPELQRQNLQLYRDVQVNTVLYTSLLNSYQQLKVVNASKVATVRVLDHAIKSAKPIKPKKLVTLLLSVFLGSVIGVILALLRNVLFAGVKDSELIEMRTGLSVIATVPRSINQRRVLHSRSKKGNLVAKDDPDDLAVESLKSLRTTIHFSLMKASNNIVLITGPAPEIGKSFISANFAAVCAQMGKSVILVDADMRRGHLNQYFNVGKVNGLADFLSSDTVNFDEICLPTTVSGLSLITKGNVPVNPAELLLTEKFSMLIRRLSAEYDYVIIDSPPILAVTDAAIISRLAGTTLMIVRYAQTHMNELDLSISRLKQAGTLVEGIVFNDVQSAVGYGYQYAYQYKADK